MQLRYAEEIPLPPIPDSLVGYTDIFRQYSLKLHEAIVRRSESVSLAFSGNMGSLAYLFLLVNQRFGYLGFLTACMYWYQRTDYITHKRIMRHFNYNAARITDFIGMAIRDGYLIKVHRQHYQFTLAGMDYINSVADKLYKDILALNENE